MSVCQLCGWTGGYHSKSCIPAPTHRIEYFGRLQVHQPIERVAK